MKAGSAFYATPVNVQAFTNDFSFQLTKALADGFTFTIESAGPTALGAVGGSLGYGAAMKASIAVKFDLYSNAGEGTDSTGMYTAGAMPTVPSLDMTSSGVILRSGDVISRPYDVRRRNPGHDHQRRNRWKSFQFVASEYSHCSRRFHRLRRLHRRNRRVNFDAADHHLELRRREPQRRTLQSYFRRNPC